MERKRECKGEKKERGKNRDSKIDSVIKGVTEMRRKRKRTT